MSARKNKKAQLTLIHSDAKKEKPEATDELVLLIRSINESARKAKRLKELQEVEPEPPMAA